MVAYMLVPCHSSHHVKSRGLLVQFFLEEGETPLHLMPKNLWREGVAVSSLTVHLSAAPRLPIIWPQQGIIPSRASVTNFLSCREELEICFYMACQIWRKPSSAHYYACLQAYNSHEYVDGYLKGKT